MTVDDVQKAMELIQYRKILLRLQDARIHEVSLKVSTLPHCLLHTEYLCQKRFTDDLKRMVAMSLAGVEKDLRNIGVTEFEQQ